MDRSAHLDGSIEHLLDELYDMSNELTKIGINIECLAFDLRHWYMYQDAPTDRAKAASDMVKGLIADLQIILTYVKEIRPSLKPPNS